MAEGNDPYGVLGLERQAEPADVRAAYRRLAKAVHPDVGGSRLLFEQVQEAYEAVVAGAPLPPEVPEPRTPPAPVAVRPRRVLDLLAAELRAKSREQWVVEGLLAAQLTIGGVGVVVVVAAG